MVWKLLSGISAACLGVALFFAYSSKNDIHAEREVEARAKANFATIQTHKQKADEALVQKGTQLKGLQTDLDKLKKDVATADDESKAKSDALAQAKVNLEETAKQLAEVQKKVDEAGDVPKLVAQVKALQADKKTEEDLVAAESGKVASLQEKLAGIQKQTEALRTVEMNSRKGVIEPTFTASIAQAFTEWGFAVLNKGNNGGVIANAELEVKRGKNVVARLKVRNVEQAISVADIVPGSVPQGYAVRQGDTVVAAPVTVKPETPAVPGKGDTKPTGTPPTGTPPADAPAPMNADPFGAAGAKPAAPAPAADPFGAAPAAPAPGAPAPAAADPFGAAPATPPPAAGAGTKASPSTADPFAK